ncbi:4-hydroxy-3-methylbut-2-enyl diphosphate reductase [Buchnera aphidicola]|uniref:4-hydroxy-3-methylbut-2-enyl diphosphate reductase n=1 Tax=Buchnera aphidicola (Aphis gossypii) TaxID=98785 RepID=A0A5J6ZD65_9GAMM|nr:4-hydroxy-3-methylbut-2-enyl diphosphate reductase [Buchnera aphidicola]QFQ31993.1 4-hydroxy-3-methylbut-2-enyl diphosphate reductase [Buchnera aphidicola (Aphis gossypii)]UPT14523.1 4-hydroxy-3-methylbut-2-enyl diphosphate reductase [Buchnera aphidicola (Aphis gossypii)]
MDVLLANPRGFCAGVKRAILIVENALKIYKKTIYVKHELVHNKHVIEKLRNKGVMFVEKISDIPNNSIIVFSAHGVSKKTKEKALKKGLIILNATCPLVTKVHKEVSQASKKNIETIFIGHKGHPEVIGTIGQYNSTNSKIHLVESIEDIKKLPINLNHKKLNFFTQTTLSINNTRSIIKFLKKKFPYISGPKKEDICYATTNRQNAMIKLSKNSDIILVIGSKNSSNSKRLTELGEEIGVYTKQIESFLDIQKKWIKNIKYIGITAGASAPEFLVQQVIEYLKKMGAQNIKEISGNKEKISFKIPKYLTISKN